jgi:transcription initiation factor TFIIH subunit 4
MELFDLLKIVPQIISYLVSHAHPQMRKNVCLYFFLPRCAISEKPQNPLLPVTVQDQIRLWELEKNRLKSREGLYSPSTVVTIINPTLCKGYLYTAFASQADYEFVLDYAKQLGVVLWENATKRCFFGSSEGHTNIRGFIERRTSTS